MRDPEETGYYQIQTLNAVYKACALSPSGWAGAREIVRFSHPSNMVDKFGATLIAPTLTVLRGWKKPLVEARDSGYGYKEYRLTPAGKRARKDTRSTIFS